MNDVAGRVTLVTGAGRGIGRSLAEVFGRAGSRVMCTARSPDAARSVASSIRAAGGVAAACALDVTDPAAAEAAVARTVEEFGRLDILINNAGNFIRGRVEEMAPEDWDRVIATDLNGVFYCARAAVRQMVAQAPLDGVRGHIIGMNSGAGVRGFPTGASYAAAKWGMIGLAESLRGEVIDRGVKVTEVVIASTVRSDMSAGRDVPKIEPEDFAETVLAVASFAPAVAISQVVVGQMNPQ